MGDFLGCGASAGPYLSRVGFCIYPYIGTAPSQAGPLLPGPHTVFSPIEKHPSTALCLQHSSVSFLLSIFKTKLQISS